MTREELFDWFESNPQDSMYINIKMLLERAEEVKEELENSRVLEAAEVSKKRDSKLKEETKYKKAKRKEKAFKKWEKNAAAKKTRRDNRKVTQKLPAPEKLQASSPDVLSSGEVFYL